MLAHDFNICPRSFLSRPNIHFLENLSAADIISRPSQPPEVVYLLNILYGKGDCSLDISGKMKDKFLILVRIYEHVSFCLRDPRSKDHIRRPRALEPSHLFSNCEENNTDRNLPLLHYRKKHKSYLEGKFSSFSDAC